MYQTDRAFKTKKKIIEDGALTKLPGCIINWFHDIKRLAYTV